MKLKFSVHFPEKNHKEMEEINKKNLANFLTLKDQAEREKSSPLNWFNYPTDHGPAFLERLEELSSDVNFYYNLVVVIGIGGSYTGTKAINDFFGIDLSSSQKTHLKPILFLGHNLSENDTLNKLDLIDNYDPLICVISKSGKTLETSIAHCLLEEHLKKRYSEKDIQKRTFFVTSETESPLLKNKKNLENRIAPIPEEIVGRFSIFTSASLLPLYFAGHKVKEILKGASEFLQQLKNEEKEALDTLAYASARFLAWNENKRIEILAYNEPGFEGLSLWWQQLFAESEGKESKGLFPSPSLFSRDLHSLGQYLQDGFPNVFETFLTLGENHAASAGTSERRLRVPTNERSRELLGKVSGHYLSNLNEQIMLATQKAHLSRNIPCCRIHLDRMSEHNLGALLAFFQITCVLSAKLLDVNPYDQPGVESYKKELNTLISKG